MHNNQEANVEWSGGTIVLVYLRDKAVFGEIIVEHVHSSLIKYENNGKVYEEWFDRDDFIVWRRIIINNEEEI